MTKFVASDSQAVDFCVKIIAMFESSFLLPAFRTLEHPILGEKVTFIKTADETNGTHTLVHMQLAAGTTGPPMHYHSRYDECFTVLEGVLGFQLGTQTLYLERGDRCTAPVGSLHRFFNPSNTEKVSFATLISPASRDFETMLQVSYGLASDGLVNRKGIPQNVEHLALTLMWGDMNLCGFFSILNPMMKRIARRAVRKGVDKMLISKYCRTTGQARPEPFQFYNNPEERAVYCL